MKIKLKGQIKEPLKPKIKRNLEFVIIFYCWKKEAADDLWWSIPRDAPGCFQPKPCSVFYPYTPACSQHARHTQTLCSFMHNMTIKLSASKVQGANGVHVQRRREKVGKQLIPNCLPVIYFPSFVSQNETNQKNLYVENSVSSFILPWHYVLSVYHLFWHSNKAKKCKSCATMCPTLCQQCKERIPLPNRTNICKKSKQASFLENYVAIFL